MSKIKALYCIFMFVLLIIVHLNVNCPSYCLDEKRADFVVIFFVCVCSIVVGIYNKDRLILILGIILLGNWILNWLRWLY